MILTTTKEPFSHHTPVYEHALSNKGGRKKIKIKIKQENKNKTKKQKAMQIIYWK